MTFKVGDTVVYPHHGAALIEAIETRQIKGVDKTYLVLKVAQGDLTVRVPYAFRSARRAAPTCEYPRPLPPRCTFLSRLSSPEICPDLRKRHSEDAVSVLPWIATEGVPVT